ncbi:c-type cytochrome [Microvirga sp. M2]|uniref:c-type cytochrome n=1 Tax=Microvirga sp. M2 TaxID=3073270 RepID=UPI0039C0BCE1
MRAALLSIAAATACLSVASGARAQAPSAPDPQRGAALAAQGNPNGAAPCSQCHGQSGEGNPTGPFPRLTGQSAAYLYKQLQDYTDGSRPSDIMTPIAQALSEQERLDAAAYYAGLRSRWAAQSELRPEVARRGRDLALRGIPSIGNGEVGVQACGNCHGPNGVGETPVYPELGGQWAGYASGQLSAFKSGIRKNDLSAVMREIAGKLTSDDIDAVSRYYESIRPRETAR